MEWLEDLFQKQTPNSSENAYVASTYSSIQASTSKNLL